MVAKPEKRPPQNLIGRRAALLLLSTALGLAPPALMAAEYGPWQAAPKQAFRQPRPTNILQLAITGFQRYISPLDGPRCSMYPTCSAYAARAVEQHGALLGSFIFVDRLYRESDPGKRQQPIDIKGYIRFFDPLTDNTFWLPRQPDNLPAPQASIR